MKNKKLPTEGKGIKEMYINCNPKGYKLPKSKTTIGGIVSGLSNITTNWVIDDLDKEKIRSNLVSQTYKYIIETNYRNSLGITRTLKFCFIIFTITLPIVVIGLLFL